MRATTEIQQSAGGALLRALLDEVQTIRQPWRNTAQDEQQKVINRLRIAVDQALKAAVRTIAGAGFSGVAIDLDSISLKKETKITCIVGDDASLHRLVDHRGKPCVLSFAPSLEEFEAGMDQIQADADQPDLPLEGELPLEGGGEEFPGDPNPGAPLSDTARQYRHLFKSIYGKWPYELTQPEKRSQTVAEAHLAAMQQLDPEKYPAEELPDEEIAYVEDAEGAAPEPVSSDGPLEPENAAANEQAPPVDQPAPVADHNAPEEIERRAQLFPNMSRTEAERICAESEVLDDRTLRAIDIVNGRVAING